MEKPRKIFLASHRNPDGDALGSTLAFYHYLSQNGHEVSMAFPSEFPPIYSWMPGSDKILIYDRQSEEINKCIANAELFIFVDANNLSRIDKMGLEMQKYETPLFLVDHHLDPDLTSLYYYAFPGESSACDLVFDVLTEWEQKKYIENIDIATCLYTGILTDTGTFSYNTSPKLFEKLSRLMLAPFNHIEIQNKINNALPEKNLRLLGYCLYHRLEIIPEYRAGIIFLTKSDFEKFNIQRGDAEGIVNYILKINNIDIAVLFTQQPTITKISFRSLGDYNVEEIAKNYFNGGGHKNASGGSHFKGLKSAITLFKEHLPEFFNKYKTIN
ncbi:DHH family phosphoesterase [Membranihabitans marinus]|uniref:DHH family phosphoesterase n=1 Tax=Membranihabitans marinus TaxID=1227546 RepID=UPI001F182EF2|nr:DHH family phosphoesterase [Membranihabitans marinus]